METRVYGGRGIKPNHCNALPRHVITVHTVTQPILNSQNPNATSEQFLVGACESFRLDGNQATRLKQHAIIYQDEFWELLDKTTRDRQTTWIVGYNILLSFRALGFPARFDHAELALDWPRSKRKQEDGDADNPHCFGIAVIQSPPTIIAAKMLRNQARIVFVDICNYFDCTISELAKSVGIDCPTKPGTTCDKGEQLYHCVEIANLLTNTFVGLVSFVKENDLGMFRYTVASQSKAMFRHGLMPQTVYPHNNPDIQTLERKAYIGGRTAVFKRGKITDTVHKLDVSSFYPSVMQGNLYPYTLNSYDLRDEYGKPPIDHSFLPYVAEVIIKSERALYPVRIGQKIVYPKGEFCTVLAGPELEQARQLGEIKSMRSWSRYKLASLFDMFVAKCWQLRSMATQLGNSLYREYSKRLANSLYGKFAELAPKWQIDTEVDAPESWSTWADISLATDEVTMYRSFGYVTQRDCGREEKNGTFTGISAFVTSYGRVTMNRLRSMVRERDILYQGVDSLIVTQAGLDKLRECNQLSDTEYGKLRLQASVNFGEIRGPTDYTLGSVDVIAGKPGKQWYDETVELNLSRYHTKAGLFTPTGYHELEKRQLAWRMPNGSPQGNYDTDGFWTPFDAATLTNSEVSAGS